MPQIEAISFTHGVRFWGLAGWVQDWIGFIGYKALVQKPKNMLSHFLMPGKGGPFETNVILVFV